MVSGNPALRAACRAGFWPMPAGMTLAELEKRVVALEQEIALLKQQRNGPVPESNSARTGIPILDEARARQPEITAAVKKAFAEMGITGEPIGAEKLQERLLAAGNDPQKNQGSRGILAIR